MESNQTPAAAPAQKLNPQQMRVFEELLQQGTKFLTQQDVSEANVKRAMAGDPQRVAAHAVAALLQQQYHAAAGAGIQPDMVTLLAAGVALLGIVAQQFAAAGVIQPQEIPAFCAAAAKLAVDEHNAGAQQAAQQQNQRDAFADGVATQAAQGGAQ